MRSKCERVVGIAEMAVSDSAEEVLVTYSLGSCIGLTLYDPVTKVGGLLHAMLPSAVADRARAAVKPLMFTDSGVTLLLQELFDRGARRGDIVAVAAGGSDALDSGGLFRIGERNHTVLRKLLWKNEILIAAEETGGQASRTMYLEMATGRTYIKSEGRTRVLGSMREG